MNSEIIKAAIGGAQVTIESDCWPFRKKANGIVVRMTKQKLSGVFSIKRAVEIDGLTDGETLEEAVERTVREMQKEIGN